MAEFSPLDSSFDEENKCVNCAKATPPSGSEDFRKKKFYKHFEALRQSSKPSRVERAGKRAKEMTTRRARKIEEANWFFKWGKLKTFSFNAITKPFVLIYI